MGPRGGAAHPAVPLPRFIGECAFFMLASVTGGHFESSPRQCMEEVAKCVRSQRPDGQSVAEYLFCIPFHVTVQLHRTEEKIARAPSGAHCVPTDPHGAPLLVLAFCNATTHLGPMSRDVIGQTSLAVLANTVMTVPQLLRLERSAWHRWKGLSKLMKLHSRRYSLISVLRIVKIGRCESAA